MGESQLNKPSGFFFVLGFLVNTKVKCSFDFSKYHGATLKQLVLKVVSLEKVKIEWIEHFMHATAKSFGLTSHSNPAAMTNSEQASIDPLHPDKTSQHF